MMTLFEDPEVESLDVRWTYIVYQKEICPKTKKDHWQGFIIWKNSASLKQMQSTFGKKAHYEVAKAPHAAKMYCKKKETAVPNTQVEFGEPPSQGRRNDIHNVTSAILDKEMSVQDVALEFPELFIKFHNGIKALCHQRIKPYAGKPEVRVYWGVSGAGKNYRARRECKKAGLSICELSAKDLATGFWDPYNGETCVIINEFTGQVSPAALCAMLDEGKHAVRVKGSVVPLAAKRFYFTSNYNPNTWWKGMREEGRTMQIEAFGRRINYHLRFREKHPKCPKGCIDLMFSEAVTDKPPPDSEESEDFGTQEENSSDTEVYDPNDIVWSDQEQAMDEPEEPYDELRDILGSDFSF